MLVNTRFIQPEELIITDPLEKEKKKKMKGKDPSVHGLGVHGLKG